MILGPLLLMGIVALLLGATWWTRRESLRLERENQRLEQEKKVVVDFMHRMATALDDSPPREILVQRIVRAALESTGATSACLFERTDREELRGVAVEGLFPPLNPIPDAVKDKLTTRAKFLESVLKSEVIRVGEGLLGQIAARGKAELIEEAESDPRIVQHEDPSLAVHSFMAVPLVFNQRCFGVLALANPSDDKAFSRNDFELVQWMGEQAALALHNAEYFHLYLERRQFDLDLALASSIQQMLLPESAPQAAGLDIDLRYAAAQKVGGDLYDIFEYPDGRLGVAVADVSGKGIPASLLMAMCRSSLRQIAPRHRSPRATLIELNRTMLADMRPGMYVTLVYAIIDPVSGLVSYARAGHEQPLLVRRGRVEGPGESTFLEVGGMPIGLVSDELFAEGLAEDSLVLESGDLILLYTDGITEAPNEEDKEFSGARLADAACTLRLRSARELNEGLLEVIARFCGSRAQRDDYALVTIKRL